MAHLLMIIDAPTSINTTFKNHYEELMSKLDSKKYVVEGKNRTGYCRGNISELHYINARYKEEVIPFVVRDMNAIILNPKTNKIKLWNIIFNKVDPGNNHINTVGKSLQLIQWFFKWFNILKLNNIIGLQPVDMADMNDSKQPYDELSIGWSYVFVFGYLKDIRNKFGEEML